MSYSHFVYTYASDRWGDFEVAHEDNSKLTPGKFFAEELRENPGLKGQLQAVAVFGVAAERYMAHAVVLLKLLKLDKRWVIERDDYAASDLLAKIRAALNTQASFVAHAGQYCVADSGVWALKDTKALVKALLPAPEAVVKEPVLIDFSDIEQHVSFADAPVTVATDLLAFIADALGLTEGEDYEVGVVEEEV